VAIKLVEQLPDHFSNDFSANKDEVSEHTNINSKIMRNRIAGYISKMFEDNKGKNEVEREN